MRDTPDLPDRFYEIYAVDSEKHWQGAVSLDALLRARRPVPIADLIDEDRRRVSVLDDQEEVARMFGKYNLVAAPVVDTDQPAGRRHHHRRRRRRHRGRGRRGSEGARRRHQRRRIVRQCLDHRAGPLQLAAGQSRDRVSGVLRARPVRGPAREDGGARGAGADRGEPGRQRRDPDHDGGGAGAGDPRTRLQQCVPRGDARGAWSASSTGSLLP